MSEDEGAVPMAASSRCYLARLSSDAVAMVCSFLSFREVSLLVRPLSQYLRDLCLSNQTWLIWRVEHRIRPQLVEDGPPSTEDVGPRLFAASPHGANIASHVTPLLLPVQLAWLAYCLVDSCPHATAEAMRRFATQIVPTGIVVGAVPGICDFCNTATADYSCVTCGKLMCSRTKRGCAAWHCSTPIDGVRHCIGLSITAPPAPTWCYACGRGSDTWTSARHLTLPIVQELLRTNPERPLLKTSMTEAQITQSCRCPHLDDRVVRRFRAAWLRFSTVIIEPNCVHGAYAMPRLYTDCAPVGVTTHGGVSASEERGRGGAGGDRRGGIATWQKSRTTCQSRNTYFCLACGATLCGTFTDGHMHQHACRTGHLLVFGTRTLNVYCFGCCRHLGLGDDVLEAKLCRAMRMVVAERPCISHHSSTLWNEFDNSVIGATQDGSLRTPAELAAA